MAFQFHRAGRMNSPSPEPDPKRRKMRKGTKSCWDCKKRKVKCTFDATSDTVCIGCRRRGAPCVGQQLSEEEFQAQYQADGTGDLLLRRLQRVEALLEHLVEKDQPKKSGYITQTSDHQPSSNYSKPVPEPCVTVPITDECKKLSEELVKAFPSQQDIDVFCKADYMATFYCHQIFTALGDRPEHEAIDFVNEVANIPDPSTTPPVLVAKRMIIFALFLQYFAAQRTLGLAEDPSTVINRLVDTAVRFLNTNENLVGCVEGLECTILEGVFHSHEGNVRRAWLAFRRAMMIGQLMKIDQPNPPPVKILEPKSKMNPKFMWFRIVYMDSHLSLMLGLNYGGHDTNLENDYPGEMPSCKLERVHTLISRRIIDRNRCDIQLQDYTVTQNMDRELLNIANTLPTKYLLPPNFSILQPNTREGLWETMRVCDQLFHYNLIHLLHLPYLLHSDKDSGCHTYSRIACVNASREVITRIIAFRHFTRHMVSVYCRMGNFMALMAGMTILLAHIDSHRLEVADWRAHQRLGDIALVEQLIEALDKLGKRTNDSLTLKSAEQLQWMLETETDTARGVGHSAHNTVRSLEKHCGELQLSIPYFGIIKIGRQGVTKEGSTEPNPLHSTSTDIPISVHAANHIFSAVGFGEMFNQDPQPDAYLPVPDMEPVRVPATGLTTDHAEDRLHQQQLQHPGLAASVNDWAFQGIDAAFFDSLIKGSTDWDQTLQ